MKIDTEDLLDRFTRYVRIDTRSDDHSETTPSTPGQWDLLRLLAGELDRIGAEGVGVSEYGYVMGSIPPSNGCEDVPTVAWFAHVDTATNLPSAAKPIVHRNYDGSPIVLPDDTSQVLEVESIPNLARVIGHDIITASGTTLLGADDKAGVAVVMAAVRHLIAHPEIEHGPIRVCFNPDEEIASGMQKLDLKELGADVGYTLDGESPGEIDFETFSADAAVLEVTGVAAHPGTAKGVMVNALRIAGQFLERLPADLSPECTEDREGFIHPLECNGSAEHAGIRMIVRDFELDGLENHRETLRRIVAELQIEHPRAKLDLTFQEQYRNMRYWLEKDMRPVEYAQEAVERAGLEPKSSAIRGGTDGSNLTARGLPTPNIFCGMQQIHSQREWISLQHMEKSVETMIHLAQIWAERGREK